MVALASPKNLSALDDLRFACGCEIQTALALEDEIVSAIDRYYRDESQRARRLGHVIRLARYLRAEDRDHEVPPAVFGAEKRSRPTPYILSPEQIG